MQSNIRLVHNAAMLLGMVAWQGMSTVMAQDIPTSPPELKIEVTNVAAPALPDISLLKLKPADVSSEAILSAIPENLSGKVAIVSTDDVDSLSESFGGKRRVTFAKMQGTKETRVIKMSAGAMTLSQVVEGLADRSVIEETEDGVVLRLPLLVGPDATLVVRGRETPNVRLATKHGAFIACEGSLFIERATVTSWDEEGKKSTAAGDKGSFRPFLAGYAGSNVRLLRSEFVDLGYDAPSGYGISLTSHPNRKKPESEGHWPSGKIVGCKFNGLYYGFYSYEARDVLIAKNEFVGCLRYGIDPHDRSTRLIIANNTIAATKGPGIIASREVTSTVISGNVVKGNEGVGIVLDRQCSKNLINDNVVFDNNGGVAFFESSGNRVFSNVIAFNEGEGVRVRNGHNLLIQANSIIGNQAFGIAYESKRLKEHDSRIAKGDAYEAKVGLAVYSNVMVANLDGFMKGRGAASLKVSNVIDDVDMDWVAKQIGEERELELEDDDPLGGDLEDALGEFDSILNSADKTLEISK